MSRSQQESWQQVEEVHCDVWNRKQGKCPCSKHHNHSQSGGGRYCALAALTIDRDAEVVIDSPETYVFLLVGQMYLSLPVATSFLAGKGKLKRKIAVQPIYDMLGPKRASAMLGSHAFTGSDMCDRFVGRTNEWCFNVFMFCDDEILEALTSLENIDPPPETCTQLEQFVCMLYRSKVCPDVNELCWFL